MFKQIFDERFHKSGGYSFEEKNVFKFTWSYCAHCDCMFVVCPKCGNNCCSAGFGETNTAGLPKNKLGDVGVVCDVCNLAYQYQDLVFGANMTPPMPSDEVRAEARANLDVAWEKLFGDEPEDKIVYDRDLNAAKNLEKIYTASSAEIQAFGDGSSKQSATIALSPSMKKESNNEVALQNAALCKSDCRPETNGHSGKHINIIIFWACG